MQRLAVADRLSSPVNRTLARLLGSLTLSQWGLLRQGRPLLFSTDPQPGELPLPGDVAQRLRTSQPIEYPASHRIYPDRPVDCALLWTDGPLLMPLSPALLDRHLPGRLA